MLALLPGCALASPNHQGHFVVSSSQLEASRPLLLLHLEVEGTLVLIGEVLTLDHPGPHHIGGYPANCITYRAVQI